MKAEQKGEVIISNNIRLHSWTATTSLWPFWHFYFLWNVPKNIKKKQHSKL